jgi:ABC-type polysaccharide/polyol phosphate export permease
MHWLWRGPLSRIIGPMLAFTPEARNAWQVRPVGARLARGAGNRLQTLFLSQPPRLMHHIMSAIDNGIAFLILERGLVLRNISIVSEGSLLRALSPTLRIMVVINAHIWFFWALSRRMPGTISYVAYNAAGFTVWNFFAATSRSVVPLTINANFTKSINVKWVHLFLAHAVWDWAMIGLAFTATLSFYALFPLPTLGPPIEMPNIPLLVYTFALATTLGAGFGMVLHIAKHRWHNLDLAIEVLYWFLFVTSGVYESYSLMPWYMSKYYWYFPTVSIIEYCRKALFSGYYVSDLSLSYSSIIALGMLFIGLSFRRWELKARTT